MTSDLWVYRDGKRREGTAQLLDHLVHRLERLRGGTQEQRRRGAVASLVVAGEIEAGLADADPTFEILEATDALAALVLGQPVDMLPVIAATARLLERELPSTLVLSSPEAFAYYGLHPEAFARAMDGYREDDALVVGIRSIGTSLSAMACAALRARGIRARRVTVRPHGPTNDRVLDVVPPADGPVIVVDEGPGLSGSTFLAVAEAYVRAGTRPEDILLVTTRKPSDLSAPDAARRWRYVTVVAPDAARAPLGRDLSAGRWRGEERAPAVCAERTKVLGPGGRLWKLEGLGLGAERAYRRACALAAEGLSPPLRDEGDGWWSSPWQGRPLTSAELDGRGVDHLATYLLRRDELLAAPTSVTDLGPAVAKNARLLFRLDAPPLPVVRPAIVDGRLMPHEWIRAGSRIVKTDAATHGDDHFFPGPTDAAWDVAGAVVEWSLEPAAVARLVDLYRRRTGDDVAARLDAWIFAYAVMRAAFVRFAAEHLASPGERAGLLADFERYAYAASSTSSATSGRSRA